MIFKFKDLLLGDSVFYNDPQKGYMVAIVTGISPTEKDEIPNLTLHVMSWGYHDPVEYKSGVNHGFAPGEWLHRKQCEALQDKPENALSPVQVAHLAALKQLEEMAAQGKSPHPGASPPPLPATAGKAEK